MDRSLINDMELFDHLFILFLVFLFFDFRAYLLRFGAFWVLFLQLSCLFFMQNN